MNRKSKKFAIEDHGRTTFYPENKRKEMADFYLQGVMECDGYEKERYMNIYVALITGCTFCKDELY